MKKLITMALTLTMVIGTCTFTTSALALEQSNGTVRLEAEDAQLAGGSTIDSGDNASNGKFISYIDENGNAVIFKNVPAAKSISIGFARGNDGPGKMSLYLNDVHSQDITFPNTEGWYEFKTCDVTMDIPAGTNVKFQFDDGDEPINIDYIDMNASAAAPKPTVTPVVKPTVKPVVKPAPKPTIKPVVKPTPKPVPVTAAKKKIAKNLAVQVKKIATARGVGLSGIVSKNGIVFGLGYLEEGLVYNETNIKANMIPKDVKKLSALKVGPEVVNLGIDLEILKGINTTKVSERTLKANMTAGAGQEVENFKGVIYQPNGDIVIAGWEGNGVCGTWMFFKMEGSQYKLYKIVAMEG